MRLNIICVFFCFAQLLSGQTDTLHRIRDNSPNRELSLHGLAVVPAFYNINFHNQISQIESIQPEFKLSFALGIRYKNKKNVLCDFQFQHYSFALKGPIYYIAKGYGQLYDNYYFIYDYGQFRASLGGGYEMKLDSKGTLDLILGASYFFSDKQGVNYEKYTEEGLFVSSGKTSNDLFKSAAYVEAAYSYKIFKNLALSLAVNYCYINWDLLTGIHFNDGYDYVYESQNLLSVNLGIKWFMVKGT